MAKGDDKKYERGVNAQGAADTSALYNQFLGVANNPSTAASGAANSRIPNTGVSLTGGGLFGDAASARGRADELYGDIRTNFDSYGASGGISDDDIARLRATYGPNFAGAGSSSGGGGGGGGFSAPSLGSSAFSRINFNPNSAAGSVYTPDFAESKAGYRNFSQTGGVDLAKLEEALTGFRGLTGEKGGFTDDRLAALTGSAARLRGADYSGISRDSLKNFEQTGGYTPEDISQVRRRASTTGSSIYSAAADQMARDRAVTGQMTGIGPTNFKLLRTSAQDANRASLDAELALAGDIRDRKFAAGSRLADLSLAELAERRAAEGAASNIDLSTQGQIDSTRLGALSGIGENQFRNQQLISGNKLAGFRGLQDAEGQATALALQKAGLLDQYGLGVGSLELGKAGGLDSWDLNKAQLDMAGRAASSAQSAMSDYQNRALAAGIEQFIIDSKSQGKQFGSSGLLDLYKSSPGEVMDYNKLLLDTINSKTAGMQGWQGLSLTNDEVNRTPGFLDYLKTIGGIGVGALTGGFGGGVAEEPRRRIHFPGGS